MDHEFAPKEEWEEWAFCAGYPREWFFAKSGEGRHYNPKAKELCTSCPVQMNCLNYAIVHNEQGIWGGLTERERKKLPEFVREYIVDKFREFELTEDRRPARIFALVGSEPLERQEE